MDDFDTPNTAPGYCPECGKPADIWNATRNSWECTYCNWTGSRPDKETRFPLMYLEDYTCLRNF